MILSNQLLPGITLKNLNLHRDNRGYLFEVIRSDDSFFVKFGQVFSNLTHPGIVRDFHKHFKRTTSICCLFGDIRLVIVDESTKVFNEILLSSTSPSIVTIPPDLFYGWKCVSNVNAITINIVTEPFDPKNPDTIYLDQSKSDWKYIW